MAAPPRLPRRPEARTEKVEDLVERVRRGLVRVPRFQRDLKWGSSDVVDLFDSLYRGYPIGSLLFYKRMAKADRLPIGQLIVEAPETSEAWWVVDGQQRLTALTVGLTRSLPLPVRPNAKDPHVLFFDPEGQTFEPPPATVRIPSVWVPVPHLLDASQLTEWVFAWEHREDEALRRVVFEAGSRIRESAIPLYLIETEDRKVAEEIYDRVNKTGKPLDWADVRESLFGGDDSSPDTLEELSRELAAVGMGRLDEARLLTGLKDAASEALPVLRRVLSFLRRDAGVTHLHLLPKPILLDVLIRFFLRFADPGPRTRTLLARWFWRAVLDSGSFDDQIMRQRGIAAVGLDEEASVQALLQLVSKDRPRPLGLPQVFDARADESRIVLLALAHLGPRFLEGGEPIDVAGLLEEQGRDSFGRILSRSGLIQARGAANRLLHPKGISVHAAMRERIATHGAADPVLLSHAIDQRAAELLAAGDLEGFLLRRSATLSEVIRRFGERMAAWDHNDRPSLDYLLAEAGVEV